jgi:cytidylate kinase
VSDSAAIQRFDEDLISRLVDLIGRPARPVVLIDGGSGAGKSTLAEQLAAALPAALVRLEDIYPGWDGLQAASDAVARDILASENPRWISWDWALSAPGAVHSVDPSAALVIEGSGSLSRENRRLATFGIWLHLDASTRQSRALSRDGDLYAPHWNRWAGQESEFADRERPEEWADVVLDVETSGFTLHMAQ